MLHHSLHLHADIGHYEALKVITIILMIERIKNEHAFNAAAFVIEGFLLKYEMCWPAKTNPVVTLSTEIYSCTFNCKKGGGKQ